MSSKNKVLIIGFGSIGRKHTRMIKKLWPKFTISIFSKSNNYTCREIELIENSFESLEKALFWNPDYVIIASPCNFHLEQALFFGGKDIPIFIEKPIGDGSESLESWNKLLFLSQNTPIMVGYVFRHDECFKEIKKIIKSNKFGPIVELDSYCGSWLPNWRKEIDYKQSVSAKKKLGGGVLRELSHEIDFVNSLFGPINIKYASSFNSNLLDINVEDVAFIHANSDKCKSISIRLNFCTNPPERFLKLRFSSNELIWNLYERVIKIKNSNNKESVLFKSNFDDDHKYKMQLRNFFSFACKQEETLCSVQDGLNVLNLISQAKEFK